MKFVDLLRLGVSSLWSRKARTAITLVGVLIGTTALVVSLAVTAGVRAAIDDQFRKNDRLRLAQVFPQFVPDEESFDGIPPEALAVGDEMSDARKDRIRRQLARQWRQRQSRFNPQPITPEVIRKIAALPHVVAATPHLSEPCRAQIGEPIAPTVASAVPSDPKLLTTCLVEGAMPTGDEAVVHEFLLYQLGFTSDAAIAGVVGRDVTIELTNDQRSSPLTLLRLFQSDASKLTPGELAVLGKAWKSLPSALDALELTPTERATLRDVLARRDPGRAAVAQKSIQATFRVVGVFREATKDERKDDFFGTGFPDGMVVVPSAVGQALFYQLPRRAEEATHRLYVRIDADENVAEVVKTIEGMGFQVYSLVEVIRQVRTNVMLVSFGLSFVALVALVVAALGITNTLYSSVLERTREIGVMKAVGARDGHVLGMFLVEGAIVGILGGLGGVLFGYLASIPGDGYATRMMAEQTREAAPETLFLYPWWLIVGVPVFSTLVTLLAAWYPARKAARVEPVVALRHE